VIVAVDGPAASGRTAWCRRLHPGFVPDESRDVERWAAAVAHEQERGIAVCDTDPIRLHYQYGLFRLGAIDRLAWRREAARVRQAVGREQLGFVDLVLVSQPEDECTDLQGRLRPTLLQWYEALEELDPGHLRFGLPDELPQGQARRNRHSVELLDLLIAAVGG
jgi:hypothetical protein